MQNPQKTQGFDNQSYKTNLCKNDQCELNSYSIKVFLDVHECFNYHQNQNDQRRIVKFQNNCFNYSGSYYYESNEPGFEHCRNIVEYQYHPLNYKKFDCIQNCQKIYCPYYHSIQEFEIYQKNRQSLLNYKQPMLMKQVHQHLNKLKQLVNSPIQLEKSTQQVVNYEKPYIKSYVIEKPIKSYYLDEKVDIYEDLYNEFKHHKKLNILLDNIAKNICAFLNVKGGTIYIGITDDGCVKGIHLDRKKRDQFQLALDDQLKRYNICKNGFTFIYEFIDFQIYINLIDSIYIQYMLTKTKQLWMNFLYY